MASCSCKKHTDFCEGKTEIHIYKISSRKFRKVIIDTLLEKGLLLKSSRYLCSGCADYCECNLISDSPSTLSQDSVVDTVVSLIKEKQITGENLSRITEAIAESQRVEVSNDLKSLSSSFKDDVFLQEVEPRSFLGNRNNIIVCFLLALCGKEQCHITVKETVRLIFAVEIIYSLFQNNVILPFSFAKNLLSYYICGSKALCNMNIASSPCGSYSSLQNWVQSHSLNPLQLPSPHDVITYFDNNQVLARNWRVRFDAKAIISAVTTVVHFLYPLSQLQFNFDLSPRHWLYSKNISDSVEKLFKLFEDADSHFRHFRQSFISGRLQIIMNEQQEGLTSLEDHILHIVQRRKRAKVDSNQDASNSKTKQDPYNFMPHNHHGSTEIIMGNPVLVNPCSYTAVKEVLEDILRDTGVPDTRKWTIIGCDGLPFLIGTKVIRENENLQDILLQPGLGHFEINMTKAIIKLLWEVIGHDLARMLGFRSPKALQACLDANDHHKAWQIVEIILFGTGDELLYPYVVYSLEKGEHPTVEGYFAWCQNAKDPNYMFLVEAIFTYALALYLFRVGIRRNNHHAILVSRLKFSPLYFGMGKINYQQIEVHDLFMRVTAPSEIKDFIEENESISQSGHPSKGEGHDFVLESRNKRAKHWLPPGAPTEKHWIQSCRNLDRFEKIRKNLNTAFCIKEDANEVYHTELLNEITQWRVKLRESEYLLSPAQPRNHTTLDNRILDTDLINFSLKCKTTRNKFLTEQLSNNSMNSRSLEPIFILPTDRKNYNAIENKTKLQIIEMVQTLINTLLKEDLDLGEEYNKKWKAVKNEKKSLLISFYKDVYQVTEHLEDAECIKSDEEDFSVKGDDPTDSGSES